MPQAIPRRFLSLVLIILAGLASGCSTYNNSSLVKELDLKYSSGSYDQAALLIDKKLGLYDESSQTFSPVTASAGDVLLHLEAAESWRLAGDLDRSIAHYDAVETLLKNEDLEGFGKKIAEGAGSALVNDTLRSYNPEPSERILSNYYKALSFWAQGNIEYARVEFNRANDRARIAVERYTSEIEEEKESKLDKNTLNTIESEINERFPLISEWEVYSDFVNPAVAYANAIFLSSGHGADASRAEELLIRVRGMVGENPVVEDDLIGLTSVSPMTNGAPARWVMLEAGLSPVLSENAFALPFVFDGAVINAALAFPELSPRQSGLALESITIDDNAINFFELASMEKVMRTEFTKRWPGTVSRAVISATTKAILQHQMAKELGPLGNLTGLAYSMATNTADTRVWRSMPDRWYVAKMEASSESTLRIPYGLGEFKEIVLPADRDSFVYIKQPTPSAEPFVEVIEL